MYKSQTNFYYDEQINSMPFLLYCIVLNSMFSHSLMGKYYFFFSFIELIFVKTQTSYCSVFPPQC